MTADSEAASFWGTNLIKPDKSASPLLEQLCLGIARMIATTLDPITTEQLVPLKLATFYRTVGGNYDSLFVATPSAGLSLVYRSLGCFHSLQPSSNPFETPSIPALLPAGFVRWQTVQLLLCPDEHVPYLQEALKRHEIVNPATGTPFPKILPRAAFAEHPDKEMTAWHNEISRRLEQDQQNVRFSRSPLHSPLRGRDDRRDYFIYGAPGNHSSRPSRANSREPLSAFDGSRRSSLPDHSVPPHLHGDGRHPPTSSGAGDMRFHHGHRGPQILHDRAPSSSRLSEALSGLRRHKSSSRQKASTNGLAPEPSYHDGLQEPVHRVRHRHSATTNSSPMEPIQHVRRHRSTTMNSSNHRSHAQSPPVLRETYPSSGSDASSETSSPIQMSGKRRSNLFPPSSFTPRHHHRRGSADASYNDYTEGRPPLPPRPAHPARKASDYPKVPPSSYKYVPGPTPVRKMESDIPVHSPPAGVKIRGGLFDNVPWDNENKGASGPYNAASLPDAAQSGATSNHSSFGYFDQKGQAPVETVGKPQGEGVHYTPTIEGVSPTDHRRNSVPPHIPSVRHIPGRRLNSLNPDINAVPVGVGSSSTRSRRNSRSTTTVFD